MGISKNGIEEGSKLGTPREAQAFVRNLTDDDRRLLFAIAHQEIGRAREIPSEVDIEIPNMGHSVVFLLGDLHFGSNASDFIS